MYEAIHWWQYYCIKECIFLHQSRDPRSKFYKKSLFSINCIDSMFISILGILIINDIQRSNYAKTQNLFDVEIRKLAKTCFVSQLYLQPNANIQRRNHSTIISVFFPIFCYSRRWNIFWTIIWYTEFQFLISVITWPFKGTYI